MSSCPHFAPDELVDARGGACGIPACSECYWYQECHSEKWLSPGVKKILERAEAERRARKRGQEKAG